MTVQVDDALYRYSDMPNPFEGPGNEPYFYEHRLTVVKLTTHGYWARESTYGRPRFILANARKRYAYPTRIEAAESFKIRKWHQLIHVDRYRAHVKRVNEIMDVEIAKFVDGGGR